MKNNSFNKLIQGGSLDYPLRKEMVAMYIVDSSNGISPILTSNNAGGNIPPQIIVLGKLPIAGQDQMKRVYDPNGIAPTLSTMQGGQQEPKILVTENDE